MLSSNGLALAPHCPTMLDQTTELTLDPLIESIDVFCMDNEYQNGHVNEFGTIVSIHLAGIRMQSLISRLSVNFFSLFFSLSISTSQTTHNFGWNGSWVEVTRYPKKLLLSFFFFILSYPLFFTPDFFGFSPKHQILYVSASCRFRKRGKLVVARTRTSVI